MATKHIMQEVQDDIRCTWVCIILLKKILRVHGLLPE
jgi:hypothetical protein